MMDWHSQDWLLVAEALASHTGADIESPRDARAWEMVEDIALIEGVDIEEIPLQSDWEWFGRSEDSAVGGSVQ